MSEYAGLRDSIVSVIKGAVEGKDVGIACSGGLDSGLVSAIAGEYADSVTLYTCGTNNSYDVIAARNLSEKLGLPWVHAHISKANVEERIRELIAGTGTTDPFTISYELQLFCVCKEAAEDVVLTGQGADEFFMGCAKFVGQSENDYEVLKNASVERLMSVSVPCEKAIAAYFGKELVYPYLDGTVLAEVEKIDPEDLKPEDLDSRKAILKWVAVSLGYPYLADLKKKSSQYGSGTTDLVRALAREKGRMYNDYIATLCDDVLHGIAPKTKGAFINARIDPVVKAEAEMIFQKEGLSPSEAVDMFYRKIIADKGTQSVRKR